MDTKSIKSCLILRKSENFKTRFYVKVEQYTTQNKKRRLFFSTTKHQLQTVFS